MKKSNKQLKSLALKLSVSALAGIALSVGFTACPATDLTDSTSDSESIYSADNVSVSAIRATSLPSAGEGYTDITQDNLDTALSAIKSSFTSSSSALSSASSASVSSARSVSYTVSDSTDDSSIEDLLSSCPVTKDIYTQFTTIISNNGNGTFSFAYDNQDLSTLYSSYITSGLTLSLDKFYLTGDMVADDSKVTLNYKAAISESCTFDLSSLKIAESSGTVEEDSIPLVYVKEELALGGEGSAGITSTSATYTGDTAAALVIGTTLRSTTGNTKYALKAVLTANSRFNGTLTLTDDYSSLLDDESITIDLYDSSNTLIKSYSGEEALTLIIDLTSSSSN